MSKIQATVIIIAKNEESAISDAVAAVSEFSQVVVVDSSSTDDTAKLARAAGAEVVNFSWNKRYPKKKQWSLELKMIENDWVLFVDADERPSRRLVEKIREVLPSLPSEVAAVSVPLRYHFAGRELKRGHKVRKIAFVDRQRCAFPEVDDLDVTTMWEVEGHYQPRVDGNVLRLNEWLFHDDPDALYDYFSRHNKYSDWEAHLKLRRNASESVNVSRSKGGVWSSRLPLRSVIFFAYSYIFRCGFLDGAAGFHYAVALSYYYWQIEVKVFEMRNRGRANAFRSTRFGS